MLFVGTMKDLTNACMEEIAYAYYSHSPSCPLNYAVLTTDYMTQFLHPAW